MFNTIVPAGHRWIGLGYLILAEDGASPACDDPDLPRDVLRVTVVGGRRVELRDGPADEFRAALEETSCRPGVAYGHGRRVPSAGESVPAPSPRRRGRRKAE